MDEADAARATMPSPRSPGGGLQVLYWCQDTAAVPFETGIQRVTRRLAQGLQAHGATVLPIGWNADRRRVEVLPASRQHGGRPLEAVAGRDARNTVVVVPKIALSLVQADLDPVQLASAYGLRTAALEQAAPGGPVRDGGRVAAAALSRRTDHVHNAR